MRAHTNVIICALRVGFLEELGNGAQPCLSRRFLRIAFENGASAPKHDLLQVDTVDIDGWGFPTISVLVVDKKLV